MLFVHHAGSSLSDAEVFHFLLTAQSMPAPHQEAPSTHFAKKLVLHMSVHSGAVDGHGILNKLLRTG